MGNDAKAESRIQRQLDVAQQITHIGSWEWDVRTNEVTWSNELYRIYGLEPRSCEITFETFLARVHPSDRDHTVGEVRAALARGGRFAYPERILRPDGSVRYLETVGETLRDEANAIVGLVGTCRDVTDDREKDERVRNYADIVHHAQTGLCVWAVGDANEPSTFTLLAFNPAAARLAGIPLDAHIGHSLASILPYARGGQLEKLVASAARDGGVFEAKVERSNDPLNPTRAVALKAFRLDGGRVGVSVEDITLETRSRRLRDAEQRVLEGIAGNTELGEVLETMARIAEEHAPPAIASILLVDAERKCVRHGAAPNLPEAYVRAIDGLAIGPKAGSCGTAAFLGKPVYVTDIAVDPLWEDYRQLIAPFGLRACWSTPIIARDGRVLGTFALYYREPRAPTADDIALIARATEIVGIALQRDEFQTQLRDLTAHVEHAREEERTGIARELHDALGQALTALKLDIGWLERRATSGGLEPAAILEKTHDMSTLSDQLLADVRRISAELRPGLLDHVGLVAAFEWLAQDFADRTSIPCKVHTHLGDAELDPELSTGLFRMLQEALTNVARHATAKNVAITLERVGVNVRMEVRDDGVGVTAAQSQARHSLGLLGIRERARRLGGSAIIAGEHGNGTTVTITVPERRS